MTAEALGRTPPARLSAPARLAAASLRLALASVLLSTGVAKALDLPGFAAIVAEYRVLPGALAPPAAALVAAAELAVGAWLLARKRVWLAAAASAALHVAYAAWTGAALARGLRLENCGCFGAFWGRPLAISTLLEDLALVALSLALAALAARALR